MPDTMEPKPEPAPTTDEPSSDSASESLALGRYVIFGQLGQGAQAETLKAVDKRLGNAVAIKRFRVGHAKAWKDVELAEREARILASLSHPALPKYVDHFEENGCLYLVMECVEGQSLSSYIKEGHRLSLPELRSLLDTLSDVLGYLHSRIPPVIHRDIKPGNIIRRPDGTFCLVDFGSVRDGLRPDGGSTVVGTYGYMAPEQFQGRASPATDVYAVGALLLALITGRPPEELPHQGLAIDAQSAIGATVPPSWVDMVSKMVNINPDERPSSLAPLIDDLDRGPATPGVDSQSTNATESRKALDAEGRDPDSAFTVMVGSGFGLVPFLALFIARMAIWFALGVAVPLVLQILSIFFGPRLRQAALQVSDAGFRARASISNAARHLRSAEPFVLQGRHYGPRARRDQSWREASREWKREWKREWRQQRHEWRQQARDLRNADWRNIDGNWQPRVRVDAPKAVYDIEPETEEMQARQRAANLRRGGSSFNDDDGNASDGKTRKKEN